MHPAGGPAGQLPCSPLRTQTRSWPGSAALEPADAVARRIDEAARFIDLSRLALSPQSGFASVAEGVMA